MLRFIVLHFPSNAKPHCDNISLVIIIASFCKKERDFFFFFRLGNNNFNTLLSFQALVLQQKGNFMELVDSNLGSDFNKEEAVRMIKVAILCTNQSPALRPTMSAVVSMLEGQTAVHDLIMDPSIYGDDLRFSALRDQFNQISERRKTETQSLILSSNATRSEHDVYVVSPDSVTISGHDLYKINSDSLNNSNISS